MSTPPQRTAPATLTGHMEPTRRPYTTQPAPAGQQARGHHPDRNGQPARQSPRPARRSGPRTTTLHPPAPPPATPQPQPQRPRNSGAPAPAPQPRSRPRRPATTRPRPGFSLKIIHIGGTDGAQLDAVQAAAIREVLQWLRDHPAQTP